MTITWEVEDGYCGHGSHDLEIDDEEFEGMTDEEKEDHISYCVQQDFVDIVSWTISGIE
jgi:hypothetical protein